MLLADMRKRVNDVDDEILRLLNKRATIVADIARNKFDAGMDVYDQRRTREILQRIVEKNSGPLDTFSVDHIFDNMLATFALWEVGRFKEWMHEKQNPPPAKVGEGTAS